MCTSLFTWNVKHHCWRTNQILVINHSKSYFLKQHLQGNADISPQPCLCSENRIPTFLSRPHSAMQSPACCFCDEVCNPAPWEKSGQHSHCTPRLAVSGMVCRDVCWFNTPFPIGSKAKGRKDPVNWYSTTPATTIVIVSSGHSCAENVSVPSLLDPHAVWFLGWRCYHGLALPLARTWTYYISLKANLVPLAVKPLICLHSQHTRIPTQDTLQDFDCPGGFAISQLPRCSSHCTDETNLVHVKCSADIPGPGILSVSCGY